MDFYIKNDARNMTILLPITPEKYEIEYKVDMETVRLTNFGDINIPTHHTPMTLVLEGLFSVNENHYLNRQTFTNYPITHAMDYVKIFREWIEYKNVVRVIITNDTEARLYKNFYIESIKYIEDGQTVGDIKYKITFREYREVKATQTYVKKTTPNRNRTTNKVVTKRTYIVQRGDYLRKIAQKFYGNGNKWTVIYNANKNVIKNPNMISIGQKLIIP